ncbi:unnamed protein product [Ostreobium quekettii]|uniref:Ferric reductase n=1 Tax=Ostreobium quekettii TaxID=121088 RepID=A0A8S1IZG6_9CHLO|nr:unnamed protein product [Ostreobium quekettii]|eukprot:evm.model.scf_307EXC.5 EVM.evm.TU.scf_307EXC.5   scf_307EXC:68834-75561(-)
MPLARGSRELPSVREVASFRRSSELPRGVVPTKQESAALLDDEEAPLPQSDAPETPPAGSTPKSAATHVNRAAFVAAAFALYAAMAIAGIALAFVAVTSGTEWGNKEIWTRYDHELQLDAQGGIHDPEGEPALLPGHVVNELALYWGLPLILILCALVVYHIPERHVALEWMSPASAALGKELPVAWARSLCGGVSVGEALFLALFTARNALMIAWTLQEVDHRVSLRRAEAVVTGIPLRHPNWYYDLDGVALSLGVTSFQNLMWLFFPIVRVSPLFDALGLPFEKRIRYHRWLGHFTMVILATHGLAYWTLRFCVSGQEWVDEALNWTDHRRVNNLAGGISLGFGVALWVTALEWTRRRYFEVFYRTHVVGFVGFLIFGILHAPGMHVYLGAGLLLYCLDLVLRLTQLSTRVKVKWSGSTSDKSIAVLGFDTAKPLCPFSTFFVNIESISKVQWHPVTPVMMGGGTAMKVCFKKFGKWTSRLVEEAAAGTLTTARLEGPYSATPDIRCFQEHEYLVMVAGGIAITPLLTILKKLVISNATEPSGRPSRCLRLGYPPPSDDDPVFRRKVVVLWTMRNISEAELMDEELFSYSRARPDLLDIRIHYTGRSELGGWTGTMIRDERRRGKTAQQPDADRIEESREFEPRTEFWGAFQQRIQRISPTALLQHRGPLHLAVLHIVVYAAAFMGLILGMSYRLEALRAGEEVSRGKVDVVAMFSMSMMAIGAATLLVFPGHLLMYRKAKRIRAHEELLETGMVKVPPAKHQLSPMTMMWIQGTHDVTLAGLDLVSGPRKVLDTPILSDTTVRWIQRNKKMGRPDVDELLDDVSGKLSPGHTAAVITAGPKPMIDSVKLAVARRNPRFHLKNPLKFEMETFSL